MWGYKKCEINQLEDFDLWLEFPCQSFSTVNPNKIQMTEQICIKW
jgi:hypothetical protein